MIHFYHGEDDLGLKRHLQVVADSFAEKYGAENISRIDAGEVDIEQTLSELVNIGLFAVNRLVILKGVFASKYLSEKIADILPRIPAETEVIIVESKPDKRVKLYKVLTKEYKSKEFILNKNIACFTMDEANTKGVEINRAGVDELINYTGGDQWRIASELEKFTALNKLVTPELVREFVEPELQASAFNVLDDLLNGRKERVAKELAKLRQQEDANKFFALLASQIFALAVAVNAGEKPNAEVAKDAGVHPFVMNKMFNVSHKISIDDVKKFSKIIAEVDEKLKTTNTDAWILIELAVSKFL